MGEVRTILLNRSMLADNDADAENLRRELRAKGTYLINVMSSPGAGKTTTLLSLLRRLPPDWRVGVMEADIDYDLDAARIAEEAKCACVQLHTNGMCHLDAEMTRQGLRAFGGAPLDLVFLENVGNLVCPAEFDTGAHMNMMLLSVPEGDDKPLKYPLMFRTCDLVLINKADTLPYFTFDEALCRKRIAACNPAATVLTVSALRGDGMDAAAAYLTEKINKEKA